MNTKPRVDENFIRFVQIIRDDKKIRQRVSKIFLADEFNRNSMINTWLNEIKLKHNNELYNLIELK